MEGDNERSPGDDYRDSVHRLKALLETDRPDEEVVALLVHRVEETANAAASKDFKVSMTEVLSNRDEIRELLRQKRFGHLLPR